MHVRRRGEAPLPGGFGADVRGSAPLRRLGVSIENWVEDYQAREDYKAGGRSLYSHAGQGEEEPPAAQELPAGTPAKEAAAGRGRDTSLQQGGDAYNVTLNELVYKWPGSDPNHMKVHQNLWTGSKHNDSHVPTASSAAEGAPGERFSLSGTMSEKWDAHRNYDVYLTQNLATIGKTAAQTDGQGQKRDLIMRRSEGGQAAQVGRKAKGECAQTFDLSYQKIGLRKN